MSLITRCPACSTLFKVTPEQLRVSDGWVRCGRCEEVFDAGLQMQATLGHPSPGQSQAVAPAAADNGYDWGSALRTDAGAASGSAASAVAEAAAPVHSPALAATAPAQFADPAAHAPDSADADSAAPSDSTVLDPFLHRSPQELAGPESLSAPDRPFMLPGGDIRPGILEPETPRFVQAEGAPDAAPSLSFMRPSGAPAGWARTAGRLLTALLALLLCVSLVLQVLRQERDRVVAQAPATRPMMQDLCALLACEIAPLQQIDAVVIDSASFTKVGNSVFKLGFTLRNSSSLELALPALEITLTDAQDQPLVRRVLQPQEFAGAQRSLAPRADSSSTLPLAVQLDANAQVAGYRLLAFYPG